MKAYCRKCEPGEKLKPPSKLKVIDWLELIQQAKAEVARGVFEDIEKILEPTFRKRDTLANTEFLH